jgi:hypothetical protein
MNASLWAREGLAMDTESLVDFLSPFLPWLVNPAQTAIESPLTTASEQGGEAAWEKAQAIWSILQPALDRYPDAKLAAEQIASKPNSQGHQLVFREELDSILQKHPELAKTLSGLLQEDSPPPSARIQITQKTVGNHNLTIAQMSGGQAISSVTADQVVISGGKEQPSGSASEARHAPDSEPEVEVKTILMLAANPRRTTSLRLGEEAKKLQAALERSRYRDRFQFKTCWAVTPTDLRRALLDYHPSIVHFSGHGMGNPSPERPLSSARDIGSATETPSEPEGLVLEDESGQPQLVSGAALASTFKLFADQIECVVLNACFSEVQAQAIGQYIPYVVGMRQAIGDRAAIEFAVGFYDAILAGRRVEDAYQMGCAAIHLEGIPEHLTPVLNQQQATLP